jgi:hypothetical protein
MDAPDLQWLTLVSRYFPEAPGDALEVLINAYKP